MKKLLHQICQCTICGEHLPFGPNPIVSVERRTRILIIGQAPGMRVHNSGIPWDDASGNELRRWLGVDRKQFYNTRLFGLMPMGFCYPGKGKTGDLPPRKECAPQWHGKLLEKMFTLRLTILIGQYAQKYYLGDRIKPTLTETVKNYKLFLPDYLPLAHPSPRNNIWMKKNSWFEEEVIPELRKLVKKHIK